MSKSINENENIKIRTQMMIISESNIKNINRFYYDIKNLKDKIIVAYHGSNGGIKESISPNYNVNKCDFGIVF